MRFRAVPTGHLNKNLQIGWFLFKFHFSHTWFPSPKLKNVTNKQRRKIFGGNIMRFKFSGTSNQDQKCSSGSNVWLLCILFRIIHCEVIKSLSKCQGNNHGSHFSLHTVRLRFPLLSGGKSSARGLSKWDVSVLRATCLWFKLQFSWSFIFDKIWTNYLFLPALRTQCDKRLKYWLMQLIRLKGGKIKCLKHCYQITQLIFLRFIKKWNM